jgi:hypothetical protein
MKNVLDKSDAGLPFYRDALADAARLIAVNGLLAESAMRRGGGVEAFAHFRKVADALDEAREIVRLAGRIAA